MKTMRFVSQFVGVQFYVFYQVGVGLFKKITVDDLE